MSKFLNRLQDNVEEQGDLRAVQAIADIARFLYSEGDCERADGVLDTLQRGALAYVADSGIDSAHFAGAVLSSVAYAKTSEG
jgi:hypothetical protein